jgi:uncharacterized RDD family membrane protein YckC/Tfp pilus assembly major pilin PilA
MSSIYSGFWRRFAAAFIDGILVYLAVLVVRIGLGLPATDLRLAVLQIVGSWLYFALQESSSVQATVGKRAVGVKVTDINGNRIGFGQATGRYFAKLLSAIILFIGYLMVVFTQRRQALHDMIANTLVVENTVPPEEIATAEPAPHVGALATTGVILVGVVFNPLVLGILAAIAIPAYQNYTVRAQVAEGLKLAEAYKAAVAAALTAGQDPSTLTADGLGLRPVQAALFVDTIRVRAGVLSIEYGRAAHQNLQHKALLLIPGKDSSGGIVWVCGLAATPPGTTLILDSSQGQTTVPAQYLPRTCH